MSQTDFSTYTLRQLFEARYWVDPESSSTQSHYLEREIHQRCSHIRECLNGDGHAAGSAARFRPYGFIFGAGFLACSIGPYVAGEFFDSISSVEIYRDPLTLSGLWAVLTSPVAATVFMIGGITDAGRVVEWFHLAGLTSEAARPVWPNFRQIAGSIVAILRRWLRTNEVRDLAG